MYINMLGKQAGTALHNKQKAQRCAISYLPGGEDPGLMSSSNKIRLGQSVGWLVGLLVGLLVCPFREAANANSEPIELGMVSNEGEDRKTLLRRGGPRRRCLVLEI